jgi:phosphoglycerate dehydrogenase-like enzyme
MANLPVVVLVDQLSPEFERHWREDLGELPVELRLVGSPKREALLEAVDGAQVLITRERPVDADVLEAAGDSLSVIIKLSHWPIDIDIPQCEARGVRVRPIPQRGRISVAEHSMALILACGRQLLAGHRGVESGAYRELGLVPAATEERKIAARWLPVQPMGLYEKVLGIIGFGEIGKEVAVRARAFGMRLLVFDSRPVSNETAELFGVESCSLPELLKEADFVTIHVPHTTETAKLLGRQQFEIMKPSAYLVNCARGAVVDEEALAWALRTERIAGAGLDVFEAEPLPWDSPLLRLRNVVLTPHIGGASTRGRAVLAAEVRSIIRSSLGLSEAKPR